MAAATVTLAGAAGCASQTPPPSEAEVVAGRVLEALGGERRWRELRGLRWTFGSEVGDTLKSRRRHAWDKHTGWHRVEGELPTGERFVFIEHLGDSTRGRAWVDGRSIEGDSLRVLLRRAKRMWTNDGYWLLMPYKLRDPGVRLAHQGRVEEAGVPCDKLALSFDGVGQTPGDRYWVFVDPSGRVVRWEYLLEGAEPPPQHTTWEGWEEHGGLWFATAHRRGDRNVFTREIETVAAFRPGEFEAP